MSELTDNTDIRMQSPQTVYEANAALKSEIEVLKADNSSLKEECAIAKTSASKHARELEIFKQRVIQTTIDWNGGCNEGKKDFLEELGLDWPTTTCEITITVETCDLDPDWDDVVSSMESAAHGCLEDCTVTSSDYNDYT